MGAGRPVHGRFDEFRGTLVSQEHGVGGELSIDAASINTSNRRRDKHLRSAAFFDVERYPEIKFTTAAVTDRRKGLTISGDLRMLSAFHHSRRRADRR